MSFYEVNTHLMKLVIAVIGDDDLNALLMNMDDEDLFNATDVATIYLRSLEGPFSPRYAVHSALK